MRIAVWDIPTRAIHWLLVGAYAVAFFSARSEWRLEYHASAGYIAAGCVALRVLWGFAGNRFARFSDFIRGWGAVKGYIKDALRLRPKRYIGHNPAVGWIVIFMLLLTAAIVVTGVVTYGGEEGRGIWAGRVSFETASRCRRAHSFLTDVAIAAVIVHICAALFHDFVLRENIILSMLTGTKEDDGSWSERVSHLRPDEGRSRAMLAVWIIAAIVGGIGIRFLPPEGPSRPSDLAEPRLVGDRGETYTIRPSKAWKAECAESCHSAFHPTLLPAESWKRIMSRLDDHYGDMVTLDEKTREEILKYLTSSSAERSTTEASKKILMSLREGPAPLRITETPYWMVKHSDISAEVFKRKSVTSKSNCVACHPGAEKGSFEDRDISVPK